MNPTETKRFNELYQQHLRMLKLRGKSLKTIDTYARAVRRISAYFDCCPDQLTLEQREHYFSDLVASHSWSTVKIDRNALKIQLTFWPLRKPGDLARPGETARSIRVVILRTPKKIFAYTKTMPTPNGLIQLQDKIVVRFALTIYPYLLDPLWLIQLLPATHRAAAEYTVR